MITKKRLGIAATLVLYAIPGYLRIYVIGGLWPRIALGFAGAAILGILVEYLHSGRWRLTPTNVILVLAIGIVFSDTEIQQLHGVFGDWLFYAGMCLLAVWAVVESAHRKRQSSRTER